MVAMAGVSASMPVSFVRIDRDCRVRGIERLTASRAFGSEIGRGGFVFHRAVTFGNFLAVPSSLNTLFISLTSRRYRSQAIHHWAALMKPGAIFGPLLLLTLLAAGPALAQPSEASICDPQEEGEGGAWFASCKQAASNGDGHAALMVGAMYWNGDGVAKDHSQAARWFEIADLAGESRAAKMLGDEAFGRLAKAAKPEDTDRAVLDVAIGWYEKPWRSSRCRPPKRKQSRAWPCFRV